MADGCVQIVAMAESNSDSEERYEIYEAGDDMFCVIGVDSKQNVGARSAANKARYKQSYREAWESMRDFKGTVLIMNALLWILNIILKFL